jgi:hypothetical protein
MKKLIFAMSLSIALCLGFSALYAQEQNKPVAEKAEKKEMKDSKQATPADSAKEQNTPMPNRDIEDIPIPYNLKLDKEGTFLVEAKGIKVGVLSYSGRVDGYSLGETMKNALADEKWKFQNMLTYKKTVSINFTKGERTCSVFIEEGFFSTRLEIRVGIVVN